MSRDCMDCKHWDTPTIEEPCNKCNDTVDRPYWISKNAPIDQAKERLFKSLDDIQKIIDDAMEKGDRSVHISIVGDKVNLSVQPYKEEGWGEWKYSHNAYSCSICNNVEEWCKPYCPACGSKMKFPELEGEKDAK